MSVSTNNIAPNMYSAYNTKPKNETAGAADKANNSEKTTDTAAAKEAKKTGNYGKTIGNAKLSKEGAKYYEELKKKFHNMEFILVSEDQKANAASHANAYANASKMVVLIDVDKIEKMATDEAYRNQYEKIIENGSNQLNQLKSSIESSGQSDIIKGYGLTVNDDGTTSLFAVLKKSAAAQKARIEKQAAQKAADKKAAAKKAEKTKEKEDNTKLVKADTVEELMQKISEYSFNLKSDEVQAEEELQVGQNFDFKG